MQVPEIIGLLWYLRQIFKGMLSFLFAVLQQYSGEQEFDKLAKLSGFSVAEVMK